MANIGIDVDGVLRNLEQYQLKKGKEFFKNVDTIDETKLEIKDIFNCTVEESEKFWLKNIWEYSLKEPIVKDASDIIALLQKKVIVFILLRNLPIQCKMILLENCLDIC